jgi:3-hydroxybutyrate dehydrogenase
MAARYDLTAATVLVTGAANGIGRGLAEAFAEQGARLILADRDAAQLERVAAVVCKNTEVLTVPCDLASGDGLPALQEMVHHRFGELRVVVNNAGVEYPTPVDDTGANAMQRWRSLLDNNVASMMQVVRAVLPLMPRGASIINQASIWGLTGEPGFSAYVASKHAVIGLTRSLAWELAPRAIRVNAVCPGWIRTDSSLRSLTAIAHADGTSEGEALQAILSAQALPEFLEPEDIAGIYLFLASDDARAITGQAIVVSNGEVMH